MSMESPGRCVGSPERKNWTELWVSKMNALFGLLDKKKTSLPPSPCFPRQNQRYQFPLVTVCLNGGSGCGYSDGSIDTCVKSVLWSSHASYGNDDDDERIDGIRAQVRTQEVKILWFLGKYSQHQTVSA